jgi:acetyl esterase/lipase
MKSVLCFMVMIGMGWGSAPALRAQLSEEMPLRAPVVSREPAVVEKVSYRNNALDDRGFNRVIEDIEVPTLTVYHPAKSAHRGAAIVICPGGGYQYVVIDREGHMLARYFQQQGITAVVLKYRLPKPEEGSTGLPRPQQDALAAIEYVRANAEAWGINRNRVGILGSSAGGHLAGSTGIFGEGDSRPDFVTMLYPVVTLAGEHVHGGSRDRLLGANPSPEQLRAFSLEKNVKPGMPPYFLVHARNDKPVPPENSEMMAAALQEAGVPVELLLVQTGGHGFSTGRDAESARWKDQFLNWLDRLP